MPSLSNESDKEATHSPLKGIVRMLAPWYAGIVAVYAHLYAIYGWLSDVGLVKMTLQDLIVNVCAVAGLSAFSAVIIGGAVALMAGWVAGLLHFFGFDSDRLFSVIRLFAIVGVIFLCGVLLLQFAFDPNIYSSSFRHAPLYWFIVVIGAAVLVATYVLFGKKLLDQLKSLSA